MKASTCACITAWFWSSKQWRHLELGANRGPSAEAQVNHQGLLGLLCWPTHTRKRLFLFCKSGNMSIIHGCSGHVGSHPLDGDVSNAVQRCFWESFGFNPIICLLACDVR